MLLRMRLERGEEKPSLGLCSGIGLFYYNHHCIAWFRKNIISVDDNNYCDDENDFYWDLKKLSV